MMRIRHFDWRDECAIRRVYKRAFAGFPWYEELSDGEMQRRWEDWRTKRGAWALIAEQDEEIVGALLWDGPTLNELRAERGETLTRFAQKLVWPRTVLALDELHFDHRERLIRFSQERLRPHTNLIWEREVIVDPRAQGHGIGTTLRRVFLYRMVSDNATVLVLTRMRDDNLPIIRIAEKLGFLRTDIRVPSSQIPGVFHEYWYWQQEAKGD